MPIFEYRCESCGQQFEKLVPRAKADTVACTACGSAKTARSLSVFGVGAVSAKNAPACASGACNFPSASPCAGGMCNMMN